MKPWSANSYFSALDTISDSKAFETNRITYFVNYNLLYNVASLVALNWYFKL